MTEFINTKSPITAYYQLQQRLKKKILYKELVKGEKLPPEFELCKIYNVSRITVRRALELLEKEGYVERLQGKGTYVTMPKIEQQMASFYSLSDTFEKMGMKPSNHITNFSCTHPVKEKVKSLFTGTTQPGILYFKRLRYADSVLYAIEDTWLPLALFPLLKKDTLELNSLYQVIRNDYGIVPEKAEEVINAVNLNARDASIFGLKGGSAAFLVERTTYSGKNIIEYTESIVRGDRYNLRIKLDMN